MAVTLVVTVWEGKREGAAAAWLGGGGAAAVATKAWKFFKKKMSWKRLKKDIDAFDTFIDPHVTSFESHDSFHFKQTNGKKDLKKLNENVTI